jgi:DNA primase
LIGAACRRELQQRVRVVDPEGMAEDRQARLDVEALQDTESTRALAAAESLLGWLHRRSEERSDGEH